MRLQLQGGEFSHHIGEELLLLTGQSFFLGPSIRHDEAERRITFTLERFRLCGLENRLLGLLRFPRYDRSLAVRTRVEVSDVESVETMWNDIGLPRERFQIEAGVVIRPGILAVTSLAEDRGKKLFSLMVHFRSLDIRLADESEHSGSAGRSSHGPVSAGTPGR